MIDNRLLANLQEIDNYTITIIIIFSKLKENQLLNSWFKKLKINKGDQAMLTWWEMVNREEKSEAKDLLKYCGLDTLAMVKIWERLREVI